MSEIKKEFETIDFSNDESLNLKRENKNIFSDFNNDSSFEKEIKKIEGKGKFFYLSLSLKFLQIIFGVLTICLILFSSYIFIQKKESFSDNEILLPICNILNGEIGSLDGVGCSSVTTNKLHLEELLNNEYKEQGKKILTILPYIYENENFLNSKEVVFLLDKSLNKLKVLDILEKFDYFKNQFTGFEKKKLQCFETEIDQTTKILSMKCEAYSSGYNSEIIGFSGDKSLINDYLSGTSISIANSFINYLNKNAGKYFLVVDRQKVFETEGIAGIDGYTNKTSFNLKLKINF